MARRHRVTEADGQMGLYVPPKPSIRISRAADVSNLELAVADSSIVNREENYGITAQFLADALSNDPKQIVKDVFALVNFYRALRALSVSEGTSIAHSILIRQLPAEIVSQYIGADIAMKDTSSYSKFRSAATFPTKVSKLVGFPFDRYRFIRRLAHVNKGHEMTMRNGALQERMGHVPVSNQNQYIKQIDDLRAKTELYLRSTGLPKNFTEAMKSQEGRLRLAQEIADYVATVYKTNAA